MAKIILHSPYYKSGRGASLFGFVNYLATRRGVQITDNTKLNLPATAKQTNLLDQLISTFPECRQFFEYEDYKKNPTVRTASELTGRIYDTYPERFQDRKDFVNYVATRPRVQKIAAHGLFTDYGTPVVLDRVAKEVSEHPGNVWTHIISLRREDAARLKFDHVKAWQDLLCAKRNEIAKAMKIRPENFRWYAAFHDESYHPHIHMIAYSDDPAEPYLTRKGILEIKSCLAREIFQDEHYHLYREQTKYRDAIKEDSRQLIRNILDRISSGDIYNPEVERLLVQLSQRLKNTGGKKAYGYLKSDVKGIVDSIIDEIASDEGVAALYDLWYERRFDILRTYTDELPEKVPLSQNKEFKSIKNMVIQEALTIGAISKIEVMQDDNIDFPERPPSGSKVPPPVTNPLVEDGDIISGQNNPEVDAEDYEEQANAPVNALFHDHHNGRFSATLGSLRLFQQICRAVQDRIPYRDRDGGVRQTDKKLRREIDDKKQAHGLRQ